MFAIVNLQYGCGIVAVVRSPPPRIPPASSLSLSASPQGVLLSVMAVETLGKGQRAYRVDTQGLVERET